MSIVIGWWAIPAIITIGLYAAAFSLTPAPRSTGSFMPDIGAGILGLVFFGAATITSLVAWLIWALLR